MVSQVKSSPPTNNRSIRQTTHKCLVFYSASPQSPLLSQSPLKAFAYLPACSLAVLAAAAAASSCCFRRRSAVSVKSDRTAFSFSLSFPYPCCSCGCAATTSAEPPLLGCHSTAEAAAAAVQRTPLLVLLLPRLPALRSAWRRARAVLEGCWVPSISHIDP
jgi:hypothetical protein